MFRDRSLCIKGGLEKGRGGGGGVIGINQKLIGGGIEFFMVIE